MLRDLTIKNYRAFKDFSIDGLARVNLIVGSNNAGKTSFLEAVYLLANQGSPAVLLQLLDKRGEFTISQGPPSKIEYDTAHLFHDFQLNIDQLRPKDMISITSSTSSQDEELSVHFKVTDRRSSLGFQQPGLQIDAAYSTPNGEAALALDIGGTYLFSSDTRFTANNRPPSRYHFVGTEIDSSDYLAILSDRVFQVPSDKEAVLRLMRLIEPQLEDIILQSSQTAGRFILRRLDSDLRLPISSAGEGLRRVFALALHSIVSAQGVLLIDEIDTGLYYRSQADVWRLLFKAAKERDIQIFATTHSWDCVEAFQEVLAEGDNAEQGYLFRLQRRGDRIYPVGYTSDDLNVAVRQAIEVR